MENLSKNKNNEKSSVKNGRTSQRIRLPNEINKVQKNLNYGKLKK